MAVVKHGLMLSVPNLPVASLFASTSTSCWTRKKVGATVVAAISRSAFWRLITSSPAVAVASGAKSL